ncbi:protein brain tumor-like, partial [Convolutriloba macropyga]|uniref:protein brain tumor-like n=1 Tax=Convolutriloba macropyga TaxID=536237 RepID=UPI003F51BCEB
ASKVYVTKLSGETVNVFGSLGSKPADMNEPAGIKCTPDGLILVSDSKNHRLKLYDQSGHTISQLQPPDVIRRPSDICMGSRNLLVVNSFLTHEVFVYQLSNA